MPINHAVIIPSLNNAPNPPQGSNEGEASPDNLWTISLACTVEGHSDTVVLLWDGASFSLPDDEANDPNFGSVAFVYEPPLG